jgi:hypothetical protein
LGIVIQVVASSTGATFLFPCVILHAFVAVLWKTGKVTFNALSIFEVKVTRTGNTIRRTVVIARSVKFASIIVRVVGVPGETTFTRLAIPLLTSQTGELTIVHTFAVFHSESPFALLTCISRVTALTAGCTGFTNFVSVFEETLLTFFAHLKIVRVAFAA